MAEKEYIEREATIKKLDHFQSHLHTVEGTHAIGVAKTLIKEIPAADVRPVRMGKWIDHQEGRWIYAKCSECETVHDVRSNFCPTCGADLRKSDEE